MADKKYPPPTYNAAQPTPAPYPYSQPPQQSSSTVSSNVVVVQQGQAAPYVHQSTVVQQGQRPPVVVQSVQQGHRPPVVVQSQTGGFFSSLGKAFDNAATELSKAADDVTHSVMNPLELLRSGNKVLIESKSCGRHIKILENGLLECSIDKGTASQFVVFKPNPATSIIKLRNVAQPNLYLAIQNGYTVGYGSGGPDCDFIPSVVADSYVTFESAVSPGSHIGVLPSGQFSAPAQTNKLTDASHFRIKFIGIQ